MSTATKPVPYACVLKPQADSRRVTGSLQTHAPIEPVRPRHVRFVMWLDKDGKGPIHLSCWLRSTHCDSGTFREEQR